MKDKITIKAPEGYKAVYSEDGSEVTFVEVEKVKERFMAGPNCIGNYIRFDGRIGKEDAVTRHQYDFGNCFETEQDAQYMADYHRASNMIYHACKLVNRDFEFVAGKFSWYPVWNTEDEKWVHTCCKNYTLSSAYVATRDECEEVIALLNSWGIKGVKVYGGDKLHR